MDRLAAVLEILEKDRDLWRKAGSMEEHVRFLRDLARKRLRLESGSEDSPADLPPAVERIIAGLEVAGRARAAAGGEPHRGDRREPAPSFAPEEVEAIAIRIAEGEEEPIRG